MWRIDTHVSMTEEQGAHFSRQRGIRWADVKRQLIESKPCVSTLKGSSRASATSWVFANSPYPRADRKSQIEPGEISRSTAPNKNMQVRREENHYEK